MSTQMLMLLWSIAVDELSLQGWILGIVGISVTEFGYKFVHRGFPGSSAGKESTCNAGDPSLIPRLGRSPGEGIGYPVHYFWAFLVAQMVKNLPAMQDTWVRSLGGEDYLEGGMATHSGILA